MPIFSFFLKAKCIGLLKILKALLDLISYIQIQCVHVVQHTQGRVLAMFGENNVFHDWNRTIIYYQQADAGISSAVIIIVNTSPSPVFSIAKF